MNRTSRALLLALVVAVAAFSGWAVVDNAPLYFKTLLNGLTLASLYFLVASGFTLVFGLMRNVNLAHGSLYLLGAYVGWIVGEQTGSWLLAVAAGFLSAAVLGLLLQVLIFRHMEGQDLRQTLVTIGLSIVLADVMLWGFGGEIYTFDPPALIYGSTVLPVVEKFPTYRLAVLLAAIVIRSSPVELSSPDTRIGMMSAPASTTRHARRSSLQTCSACCAVLRSVPGSPALARSSQRRRALVSRQAAGRAHTCSRLVDRDQFVVRIAMRRIVGRVVDRGAADQPGPSSSASPTPTYSVMFVRDRWWSPCVPLPGA